ncbi:hypothetical protein BCR41DRAFT_243214 [Lobosporangium transversale]|uniref:Uncharacterized protein n=1 Tax=Lobosporangium transversale TaxID=64571 RepID=A0A1Y2G588_9FUNG|nr:hypothetical protein BCR41DRAFT_243214 [Lobosporangium transversale]ORY94306.1 hypothetical protein BCR41DRAFT_243214 [Lobosporangium transversale]|eukprot:XP_021875249.1 hypothetical protein BCR41DRAFT_243214 [Lobosporangium transversale]
MNQVGDCIESWIRFEPTNLPPANPYLNRTMLQFLKLDILWVTKVNQVEDLIARLALPDITAIHSPEAMALEMSMTAVLRTLTRQFPLIFSPKDISKFVSILKDVPSLAYSLCRIYDRSQSPGQKQCMSMSFERLSLQYPSIPQNNRQMLVECGLESKILRIKKFGNRRENIIKQTTTNTIARETMGATLQHNNQSCNAEQNRDGFPRPKNGEIEQIEDDFEFEAILSDACLDASKEWPYEENTQSSESMPPSDLTFDIFSSVEERL